MKLTLCTFLSLVIMCSNAFAQKEGKKYEVQSAIWVYKFEQGECRANKKYALAPNIRFTVESVSESYATVELLNNWYSLTPVVDEETGDTLEYLTEGFCCVPKKFFATTASIKESGLPIDIAIGALAAPFKFQAKDFKIYPAGQLGLYIGPKIYFNRKKPDNYLTIPLAGGFTQVPLNDLNATNSVEVRSVLAGSVISGVICSFGRDFQFGILGGYDFFNADNTKYQRSWISFTIGFNFLRSLESKSTAPAVTVN